MSRLTRAWESRPEAVSTDKQVHESPAGSVRHVHGIYHDPFSNALWCLAGDVADECRISRTFNGFSSLETIDYGNESWRCVSLLFTESHVCASPKERNLERILSLEKDVLQRAFLHGMLHFSLVRLSENFNT